MMIWIDSREKDHAIQKILNHFQSVHTKYFVSKLPVGDYMSLDNPRLVIDRKQNLSELCQNVCQDHKRFRSELERANEYGIKLIILCEHGGAVKELKDVIHWINPRLWLSPMAMSGERLYKVLSAMGEKYGVRFEFCKKADTGEVYVLEFSRESVRFAEQRGFKISELLDFPQTNIPNLFFYAFRKNHKNVARDKTDKFLDELGGLSSAEITRLVELYNQPNESLILAEESGRKNCRLTVEL